MLFIFGFKLTTELMPRPCTARRHASRCILESLSHSEIFKAADETLMIGARRCSETVGAASSRSLGYSGRGSRNPREDAEREGQALDDGGDGGRDEDSSSRSVLGLKSRSAGISRSSSRKRRTLLAALTLTLELRMWFSSPGRSTRKGVGLDSPTLDGFPFSLLRQVSFNARFSPASLRVLLLGRESGGKSRRSAYYPQPLKRLPCCRYCPVTVYLA